MPYRLSLEGPFVRVDFFGLIVGADLLAVKKELDHFELELGRVPDRLVDLSGIEATGFTLQMTLLAARLRREQVFPNSFRSALLAPTPVSAGFARIFKTLNNNPQIELQVFETLSAAEDWLNSTRSDGREARTAREAMGEKREANAPTSERRENGEERRRRLP